MEKVLALMGSQRIFSLFSALWPPLVRSTKAGDKAMFQHLSRRVSRIFLTHLMAPMACRFRLAASQRFSIASERRISSREIGTADSFSVYKGADCTYAQHRYRHREF